MKEIEMTSILSLWKSHGRAFALGDIGYDVTQIQQLLLAKGYDPKGTDGEIGTNTRRAIVAFQKASGLLDDGRIGELTATAMDGAAAALPNPVAPVTSPGALSDGQPPWLVKAISLIGTLEAPGTKDNPVILAWAKACGGNIAATYHHDSVAWCAMFREYCLKSTGYHGVDSLWALDSRNIGTALKGPAVGAIASKSRNGGGHTFIVRGRDKSGHIVGVGGNQSDSVCNANFDPAVLKYNWPAGYPLPAHTTFSALPIVAAGKFTREN